MNKWATIGLLGLALAVGACGKHDAAENNTASVTTNDTAVIDDSSGGNASENAAALETGNGSNVTP